MLMDTGFLSENVLKLLVVLVVSQLCEYTKATALCTLNG